jgi:hypothetical protein
MKIVDELPRHRKNLRGWQQTFIWIGTISASFVSTTLFFPVVLFSEREYFLFGLFPISNMNGRTDQSRDALRHLRGPDVSNIEESRRRCPDAPDRDPEVPLCH